MSIFCFGLSHRTAAVDVRERFAISQSALPTTLAQLKTVPGVTEGVIVSTCNRTGNSYASPESSRTARLRLSSRTFIEICEARTKFDLFRLCASRGVCSSPISSRFWSGINGCWGNGNFWSDQTSLPICDWRTNGGQISESTFFKNHFK